MFPARAGMSRRVLRRIRKRFYVPRASGDEPHATTSNTEKRQCSPRERG